MSELQFTVPAEQSGKRIDCWLAEQIEGLTRSRKITSWPATRRLRFSFRS